MSRGSLVLIHERHTLSFPFHNWGGGHREERVPVIGFHGSDPGHQAKGSLRGFLHHLRLKVGGVHVGPDLGNDLRRNVVLVICLKLLQEPCSAKDSMVTGLPFAVETGEYKTSKRNAVMALACYW